MKKYIIGAVLSLGMLVSPTFTHAAGLTSSQISAIIGLLQSFGADQSVINNVQASLGGTTTGGGNGAWCHTFNTNLTIGSDDVRALDKALLKEGVGNPTSFEGQPATLISDDGMFIENTAAAVVQFQAKYGIRQTGYVGPITRAKLNSLYGCSGQSTPLTNSSNPNMAGGLCPTGQTWSGPISSGGCVSQTSNSGPAGIPLPSNCKVVGSNGDLWQGSKNPVIPNGYILLVNQWAIDCGSTNNDNARGILGPVLEKQGWIFCDSGLATGHWWKGGILTSVIEGAGNTYPFRVDQQSSPNKCY